jgi:hypothetical protein
MTCEAIRITAAVRLEATASATTTRVRVPSVDAGVLATDA